MAPVPEPDPRRAVASPVIREVSTQGQVHLLLQKYFLFLLTVPRW